MSGFDHRSTPANDRVAAERLRGIVDAPRFVTGEVMGCTVSAADILTVPGGGRASQLLFGDPFDVLETRDGIAFGQNLIDGYCGYVARNALGPRQDATHWVAVPGTHVYPRPKVQARAELTLHLGSGVSVSEQNDTWARLGSDQYIPTSHLVPMATRFDDPVAVTELFLGTPYFWGGLTRHGIDCSGLVQIAWRACGWDCPRDSDMQQADLGQPLEPEQIDRGDLIFWDGHVALCISPTQIIHANAHHMAVVYESIRDAIKRIENSGGGSVTAIKRP